MQAISIILVFLAEIKQILPALIFFDDRQSLWFQLYGISPVGLLAVVKETAVGYICPFGLEEIGGIDADEIQHEKKYVPIYLLVFIITVELHISERPQLINGEIALPGFFLPDLEPPEGVGLSESLPYRTVEYCPDAAHDYAAGVGLPGRGKKAVKSFEVIAIDIFIGS